MAVTGRLAELLNSYLRRRLLVYVLVITIFLMGSIFGALAVNSLAAGQRLELTGFLQAFFQGFTDGGAPARDLVAKQSLYTNVFKTAGLIWLLGLSVIGVPLILVILFTRGFVLGFTVGFFVKEMSYKGIFYALVSVLPHNILIIPAMIIASVAAISFAAALMKGRLGHKEIGIYHQFLGYTVLTALAILVLVVAALVEGYVTPVFIELAARYLG